MNRSAPGGIKPHRPKPSEPGAASRSTWLRLPVVGPLALGIGLMGLFVVLLLWQARDPEPVPAPTPAPRVERAPEPASDDRHPLDVPEGFEGSALPGIQGTRWANGAPPAGKGLERWSLETAPEGWDPVLAAQLSDFFARMDMADMDPERLKALEGVREELRQFLASLGPESIPTLAAILNVEADFVNRRFLLYAMGDLGPRSEEATFPLIEFYDRTQGQLGARSETNHIIEAMGRLKNDTAFQEFNRRIDEPGTPAYDRDKFLQALGEHPRREESLGRFIHHGREDEDTNTRNHSWQAIGKMGGARPEVLPELISAFEKERVWWVRQTILGSIGKTRDPAALPFLEKTARTAEPSGVRLSAANAIKLIGTPQAPAILRSVAAGEREENVRNTILRWLEAK